MASGQPKSSAREMIGDIAPKLVALTEQVLSGDIWERGLAFPSAIAA
jgi:hypothetical protein